MKANELRIGNLVLGLDNNVIKATTIEVGVVRCYDIEFENKGGNDYPEFMEDLKPIQLTEEWLVKFEFDKNTYSEYHLDKIDFPFYYKDGKINISPGGMADGTFGIDITCEYVHKLQNLYFALTGEELILK